MDRRERTFLVLKMYFLIFYLFYMCLSQGFYSCTNIMTKKQVRAWGGKGLFGLHFHTAVHHQGSQDWNSSRSGSRSWYRGHGGMFFTGLLPLACSVPHGKQVKEREGRPSSNVLIWSPAEGVAQTKGVCHHTFNPRWPWTRRSPCLQDLHTKIQVRNSQKSPSLQIRVTDGPSNSGL